ncbi:MAG: hypothetical protein GY913_07105 [Proteobacteria bacterium]|nr:hypothetical protein [Pseudomonadota bacterium]MCP4916676.1 hypothetical protein [Pseudomonadota bacterium]
MPTLFVDETGDFRTPDSHGAVVGLVAPTGPEGRLVEGLDDELREVFVGLPWPPHATDLNIPIAHAVRALELGGGRLPRQVKKLAHKVGKPLKRHVGGSLPAHASQRQLKDWDGWLAVAHPELRQELIGLHDRREAGLARVLRKLGSQGAWVLVAATRVGAPDEPAAAGQLVRDTYVRALRLLIERLHALSWSDAGTRRLTARICDRSVRVEGMPRAVPLSRALLEDVAREASEHPALAATDARRDSFHLDVSPGRTVFRGDDVLAGVVLADWLANRVGRVLRTRDWTRLTQRLDHQILHGLGRSRPMALCPGLPSLTTVAFDGEARRCEHEAFEKRGPVATRQIRPDWARVQAEQWVHRAVQGGW